MDTTSGQRRDRLFDLVHNYFGGDNDVVLQVIKEGTPGARVSIRSIQAWLMAPGRASSRNCPPWALKALEEYVADPANHERLQMLAQRQEAAIRRMETPTDRADRVRSQRAVEIATSELEEERRSLEEWQALIGKEAGRRVSETVQGMRAEIRALRQEAAAIFQALHGNAQYEEFRKAYLEHERADRHAETFVKDARRDIESGSGEFACDDAVPQPPTQD
jgi:hypothetical protein